MKHDLRLAWRAIKRRPSFALLAIAPLAMGIGLSTGVFSIANALLLRPLPFPNGARLVFLSSLHASDKGQPQEFQVAAADLEDWRRESRSFDSIGGALPSSFNLSGVGVPQRVPGARVTASLLRTLAVVPSRGRFFTDGEVDRDAALAVISHEYWKRQFAKEPSVLGRTLDLDGRPYAVVGVLPPAFRFGPEADVWIPFQATPVEKRRSVKGLNVVGRLKNGVSRTQAAEEMRTISASIARRFPDDGTGWSVSVRPLRDVLVETVRSAVWVLFAGSGFLLLIACANVSNLLLARSIERRGESAVRAALGAGRGRLLRSCLLESAILAAA